LYVFRFISASEEIHLLLRVSGNEKLGFIDSGRIVYDNSLKKANQKKNRELMIIEHFI